MTIQIASNTFGDVDTHQLPQYTDWELRDSTQQWFGVKGESIIPDVPHGRNITIEVDFVGFADQAAADQAIDGYAKLANQLSGTLTVTANAVSNSLQNVLYKGLQRHGPSFFDAASGTWIASVVLLFRHLKP